MSTYSVEDALDQLAAVPPRAFTKERNALAARLAKLGHAAAAAKIKARRAPTIPVWAVNRLATENPGLVDALISAADRVGAAQLGRGTAMPLAAAMTGYREATDAVLARLDDVLAAADVNATNQVRLRIQNTLMAAAADPKVRKLLRAGSLEQELAAAGFDLFSGAVPSRPRATRTARGPKRRAGKGADPPGSSARERRAAAREARARLRTEARAASDREKAAAEERLRPLRDAAAEAARMLARLREDARRATAAVGEAARRKRAADQALRAGRAAFGRRTR